MESGRDAIPSLRNVANRLDTVNSRQDAKVLVHLFSQEACSFLGSPLKKAALVPAKHAVIPLAVGRPHAELYPWESFEAGPVTTHQTLRAPETSTNGNQNPVRNDFGTAPGSKEHTLATGLNYCDAQGHGQLVRFLTEHVQLVHDPPYRNWATIVSAGTTSALEMAMRIFCDRGDTILVERYTYPGAIACGDLVGVRLLGIEMDEEGLIPSRLDYVLNSWDATQGSKPRLLYTIPCGQNPTTATQSLTRKRQIYEIAEQHDLVIIEDDPYYFLGMGTSSAAGSDTCRQPGAVGRAKFLSELLESFLSLDTAGRVVRLDSASKILAPGLRIGWVTASRQIIDKFLSYTEISTVSANGPSQLMLSSLLDTAWGHDGFFSWLDHLSQAYCVRMTILLDACERFLPASICRWAVPRHGIFLWIKVDMQLHPTYQSSMQGTKRGDHLHLDMNGIEDRIHCRAMKYGVQVTKGSLFNVDRAERLVLHFRLTYAAAEQAELTEGLRAFARAVREEFGVGAGGETEVDHTARTYNDK